MLASGWIGAVIHTGWRTLGSLTREHFLASENLALKKQLLHPRIVLRFNVAFRTEGG